MMNIKQAKQEIVDTVQAYLLKNEYGEYVIPRVHQRPVLLLGAPGIGKTQIMEQAARECKVALVAYTITHHTRQSAIGLPFISKKEYGGKEYSATEYTMSEIVASIYDRMRETGLTEGILFIDEINCVSETLAPAMLQFLQCKTFGNHEIPEGWVIVAAGNPPEYNKSVRDFDVVTLDRVKKIMVEPDYRIWKEYAYKENIHPAILSYLELRSNCFYQMETTIDGRQFATPRGWEDLSRMMEVYERLNKKQVEIRGDEAACAIQPGILAASEEDWGTEYLDKIISMKTVSSIEEAIEHINTYNTGHSESIITENYTNALKFQDEIDAAAVYVNASTRFTDGFEFGYGAEIGISTQKLHARGPMGLEALTTIKYIIFGNGQIRR